MKHRVFLRILCAVLAVCLAAGLVLSVGALSFMSDISGDGEITAFDAQILAEANAGKRTLSGIQQSMADKQSVGDILSYIFGRFSPDAGDPDGDGVIEIYTAEGLELLHTDPTADYILMNDLDLAGADWTPVVGFSGSFDGNGHSISNLTITESAVSCMNAEGAKVNMGFFGDTTHQAVISDLHLRNVTVAATEEALYLGLLGGSVRGQMDGCTATGTISDDRATHSTVSGALTFIGVLAGRIPVATDSPVGSVIGGNCVCVFDEQGKYETTGLCADVKLRIADRNGVNLVNGISQKIGLVGWAPKDAVVSGIWADGSCSSDLLSADIQRRQDIAVDYMNAMGSVAWTPTQTLVYQVNPAAASDSSKTYYAGTTYYGLPYNHHNGSLERFLSAMEGRDENGIYTTRPDLGDSIYTVNENGTGGYEGFVQLMGNDCSTSLAWAWLQISPIRVSVTTETYAGGVGANRTRQMVPNDENREKCGVYPIGTWTTGRLDPLTGKLTAVEYDPALAAYPITDERSSEDILAAVGTDGMLEIYARTHKADGLVRHRADPVIKDDGTVTYSHFGHCRMVVADPVVIRGADGTIDGEKSYFLTTEQGSSTGKTSTWKVNYQRSFASTLTYNQENPYTSAGPYLPVTIRALQDEAVKAPYFTPYPDQNLAGPVSGKIYTNYRVNSVTVTVTDETGTVLYDQEAFTGISFADGTTRGTFSTIDLAALHSEAFAAAAQESLIAGQTYYYTVTVRLSDGSVTNLNKRLLGAERSAFTYSPAD